VVGVDINSEKIDLAIKGAYTKEKLKDVPQKIIDKYFIKKDDLFFVDKTLKTNISFKNLNVLDPRINNLGKFDVIFSRNMFIYFDENAKEKAIKNFYHILKEDGYLFLGHTDSAKNISKFFKHKNFGNSTIYQKIKGAI
jgi:chemotaxis protein methyltransferase CheR